MEKIQNSKKFPERSVDKFIPNTARAYNDRSDGVSTSIFGSVHSQGRDSTKPNSKYGINSKDFHYLSEFKGINRNLGNFDQ